MKKERIFELIFTAILLAIIILQSFIPFLGNLPLVFLDITIVQVTVIVGGIVLGVKAGVILGLVWGLCSFFRSFTSGSVIGLLVFTNPIIAIVPRVVVGWLAAQLFLKMSQTTFPLKMQMSLVGLVGSLCNTFFVLGLIYMLVGVQYAQKMQISMGELPKVLMMVIVTNGIPEAIASTILVPSVASLLLKLKNNRRG